MDKTLRSSNPSSNHGPDGASRSDVGMARPEDAPHGTHHVPVHYLPQTRGRVIVFAVVLVLALLAIAAYTLFVQHRGSSELADAKTKEMGQPVFVEVVRVKPGAKGVTLSFPGEARPFYDSTIFARTSGYLKDLLADIGDRVKEGQLLATIETPELDDQMNAARAKLEQLKAEVHVAETSLAFAKLSFDRWNQSTSQGAVSQQETDQKKSEMESSVAKLESARAQVSLGDADVQRLNTLITFKEVKAPFAGTVTERHVDVGELVTAGSTNNTTSLFTLVRADPVRVYVDVPQGAAPDIKMGMSAVAEFGGRKFTGKVDRTADSIDLSSRTMRVEVLVPNPDRALIPGTYLQVSFQTLREHPPLQIPSSALSFRTSGPQVAIVNSDARVHFCDVTITRDSGDIVEVEGLKGDEILALNIGNSVAEAEQVKIHDTGEKKTEAPAKPTVAATAPTTTGPVQR